jgi:hypothetical protein
LDDDEKGQKIKKDIIKIGSGYKEENVFTIRDLCGSIKSRGTIEDTLPVDYVTSKTNEILHEENIEDIELDENRPCGEQIKLHLQQKIELTGLTRKEKKDKVENILLKIKKTISDEYKCTRQPNQNAPLLYSLAEKIIEII